MSQTIDPALLAFLICPVTRSRLRLEGDALVSTVGGLRYPIREGVPVLLEAAAQLPEGIDSLNAFRKKFGNVTGSS